MANHKSTLKSIRKSASRRERNRYYGKTTRNAIRDFNALESKEAALEQLPVITSMVDKLAKKNILHKNKAGRIKSQLQKKISTLA
ncbi:MAG TPA: 30S ribosomal protein S20 [Chitinophagaceae bacterium]|nr:30S ribosomal protein S20 [Chitinophagaceae bacterium]